MAATIPPVKTTFTYKTDASAGDIPAYVYYAPSETATGTKRPVAIIFHAGGFTVGGAYLIPAAQINTLVSLGFVVVTPEYRLAPHVSLYEGPLADAKAVLQWVQDRLPALLSEQEHGVAVDGARVAVMGHSAGATLALHLGGASIAHKPVAILDLYGPKDYQDKWASQPLAVFAQVPSLPQEFIDKVHQGPTQIATPPMIKEGRPDLSSPRNAWMITTLRDGTNTRLVVKDGDFSRADPICQLSRHTPPAMFVHGDADVFVPQSVSRKASDTLQALGVRSEFVGVPGAAHVFDMMLSTEDPLFRDYVLPGLKFLAKEAGL